MNGKLTIGGNHRTMVVAELYESLGRTLDRDYEGPGLAAAHHEMVSAGMVRYDEAVHDGTSPDKAWVLAALAATDKMMELYNQLW